MNPFSSGISAGASSTLATREPCGPRIQAPTNASTALVPPDDRLHRSVAAIADPAIEAKLLGLLNCEMTETHRLHETFDA